MTVRAILQKDRTFNRHHPHLTYGVEETANTNPGNPKQRGQALMTSEILTAVVVAILSSKLWDFLASRFKRKDHECY